MLPWWQRTLMKDTRGGPVHSPGTQAANGVERDGVLFDKALAGATHHQPGLLVDAPDRLIHAVNSKNVLCQIDATGYDGHRTSPSNMRAS